MSRLRLAAAYNRGKVRTNKECGWIGVDIERDMVI